MKKLVLCLFPVMLLAGCASTLDDQTYSRDEARRVQTIEFGTLEALDSVTLEGERSGISNVAGAVVGGIAGSTVGGGKGAQLTSVLGAIAGSVAGESIQERATRAPGLQLTVRLDTGGLISVVQEASDEERFEIGQRVRIVRSGGEVRVSPWQ